jgi:hypothetical protein
MTVLICRMALSNAERQRRWRQKQKERNNQNYLKKERLRKKDKYIPTHLLPQEKKEARRKKCREDFKKHYERMKKKSTSSELCTSKSNTRETRSSTSCITVKFPFQQKKKGVAVKRRYRSALRKAYRDISELQSKCLKLQKGKKNLQKKLQRERAHSHPSESPNQATCGTPSSKTKLLLKKSRTND